MQMFGNMEIISSYKKIIMDTSSAMHYKGFAALVESIEKTLEMEGKKIYIPKVVWLELIRAYNSSDSEKVERAHHAISIISSHRNIFEIESEEVFQDEIDKSFADPILLCDLIMGKRDSNILLITNDRMLSCDANEINHQASCKGNRIETYFISDNGKLCPGCKRYREEPQVIIKEVEKVVEVPIQRNDSNGLLEATKYIGTLLLGAGLGVLGTNVYVSVKNNRGGSL